MVDVKVGEPQSTDTKVQPAVWREEFDITADTTKTYNFNFTCPAGKKYHVVVKAVVSEA